MSGAALSVSNVSRPGSRRSVRLPVRKRFRSLIGRDVLRSGQRTLQPPCHVERIC